MTELFPLQFQPRDIALLKDLFESRIMTLAHVTKLHFDGKPEAAKKRVQKLKVAGVIAERPRRVYEPSILLLTRRGYHILESSGGLDSYPTLSGLAIEKRARVSDLTLRHELGVMDVKATFVAAIRAASQFQVIEFSTWPRLYEFKALQPDGASVTVKPDAFIRIAETAGAGERYEHTFFLEVDRSTETQETVAIKAACYRDYYRSGGFAVRSGGARQEHEAYPFRVLMVFRNAERRNNAAERLLLLSPPVLSQAWLTTFTEVTTNPLGPIWIRPGDYRTAVRGTAFDAGDQRRGSTYRRQSARETHVEGTVPKHALLTSDPSA
jgi:hypothetical protein